MALNFSDVYWKRLKVNAEKDYSLGQLTKIIHKLNDTDKIYLINLLGGSISPESLSTELYRNPIGKQLFCLNKYVKNKIHYAKHVFDLTNEDDKDEPTILMKIFEIIYNNNEELERLHLYYLHSSRQNEQSYSVEGDFNIDLLKEIFTKSNLNGVIDTEFDSTYKEYLTTDEYITGVFFPSDYLKLAEDFKQGTIVFNPRESCIIYYDAKNNNFIFRGVLKHANQIKNYIEAKLEIKLVEWSDTFKEYDPQKFINRLQSLDKNSCNRKLSLTAICIKGLLLDKNINFVLSQSKNQKVEIAYKLGQVLSDDLVAINSFKDLEYLKIFYKVPEKNTSKEREVRIVYNPNNTKVKLLLESKDLPPEEKAFVYESFLNEFGIPLDESIKPELFQNGVIDLYRHILQKTRPDEIENSANDIFKTLVESKIIEIIKDDMWQCAVCQGYNKDGVLKCPDCETDKPKNVEFISTYSLNSKEVLKLIKRNMTSILELESNWEINEIKATPYLHFRIINKEKNEEISVILITSEITPKTIANLKLESRPTLFILSNDRPSIESSIKKEELFFNISLELMLAYDQPTFKNESINKSILKKLEFVSSRANLLANNAALKSFDRLKDIKNEYSKETNKGDIFEIDIFNIIRNVFPSAIQLGKKRKGQRIPDGYFDLHMIKGGGVSQDIKYTFLWDAKHSDLQEGYDFNIGEKRKIVEYINNYNQNSEVINYSSNDRLDCFFIISNNFNNNQFDEIGKYIMENTNGWSGSLVFLELNALLEIMNYVLSNKRDYLSKINMFKYRVCSEIFELGTREKYIHVTPEKTLEVLNKFKQHSAIESSVSDKIEV